MKKALLFTTIIIFAFVSSDAQITKGSILLGGGIYLTHSTNETIGLNDDTHSIGIGLTPAIGLAIRDNLVTGIRLDYNHTSNGSSVIQGTSLNENNYGGGLFIRKYIPLGKSFYLFGETSANYSFYKQLYKNSDVSSISKINDVDLYLYPGVTYAVNRHFHLEASLYNLISLYYSHQVRTDISPSGTFEHKSNAIELRGNVGTSSPLNIGFRFLIGK